MEGERKRVTLAGASRGSSNPGELSMAVSEPCQFHRREIPTLHTMSAGSSDMGFYGLLLPKVPVVCSAFSVLCPLALSQN